MEAIEDGLDALRSLGMAFLLVLQHGVIVSDTDLRLLLFVAYEQIANGGRCKGR